MIPPPPGSPGARAPPRRTASPAALPSASSPGRLAAGMPGARGPPLHGPRPCRYDRRYDTGMAAIACAWCGIAFAPAGRRKSRGGACRQASYRARGRAAPPRAPAGVPAMAAPRAIVCECAS